MRLLLQWFSLWHPEMVVLELLLAWLYLDANRQVARAGIGLPTTKRQWAFFVGLLLVSYIALGSPLAEMAETQSFSVFVIQSMLMTLVMPWLLLTAMPTWLTTSLFRVSWLFKTAKVLTHPLVALVLYNTVTSLILIPVVFKANLTYNWLHVVDLSALMVVALCMWWPLVSTASELPQLNHSSQLLYMLFSANFMMPIPFFLIGAEHAWYKSYLNVDPLNSLTDQHLGAILLVVGTVSVYGVRALIAMVYPNRTLAR